MRLTPQGQGNQGQDDGVETETSDIIHVPLVDPVVDQLSHNVWDIHFNEDFDSYAQGRKKRFFLVLPDRLQ